jgi:tRNA pseudouridine55 synthase
VQPRQVTVHALHLLAWEPPRLCLFVECGPGTYIRSLARDLGEALRTRAYLHALRRVSSGAFRVEEAPTLEALEREGVETHLRPPDLAVVGLPAMVVRGAEVVSVTHGGPVTLNVSGPGAVRVYDESGRLLALGESRGATLKPFLVFRQPA